MGWWGWMLGGGLVGVDGERWCGEVNIDGPLGMSSPACIIQYLIE